METVTSQPRCPECQSLVRTAFTKTLESGEWELIAFCNNPACEMATLMIEGKGDQISQAMEDLNGQHLLREMRRDKAKAQIQNQKG